MPLKRVACFLSVSCLLVPLLCSSLAADEREAAVRSADSLWANAVASKALEQTVAMYDSEAVTAGSAMFPARGPDAFRLQWKKLFALPNYTLTWNLDTIIVLDSGELAYSSGTWRSGKSVGPYLALWRKQPDGKWKVLVDAAWVGKQ